MVEEFNQNNEEEMEEKEVNVMEFGLYEDQIDELIEMLEDLREKKESVSFTIDDDNDLTIHFEDSGEEDEGDEEDFEDDDGEEIEDGSTLQDNNKIGSEKFDNLSSQSDKFGGGM